MNQITDLAVVGAGPAGMMAAITAASNGNRVILIEKNTSAGKKLLITGNGRCNLTNTEPMDQVLKRFQKKGSFLRTAFTKFTNQDLIKFFESRGLKLKVESDDRVFPVTDNSNDVLEVLLKELKKLSVNFMFNSRVNSVHPNPENFELKLDNGRIISAKNVVLATGGVSYKATGSEGDGHLIAEETNHKITPLKPGIVPLKISETWKQDLSGIQLEAAAAVIKHSKGKLKINGDLLFTHQGVSGPMILDNSSKLVEILGNDGKIFLNLDIKPYLTREYLAEEFLNAAREHGKVDLANYMKLKLPNRMIPIFLDTAKANPKLKMNQLGKKERNNILNLMKSFPITVTGHLPMDRAMITCGGVSSRDFDPNTMESKHHNGMFFAGEIVEGCGPSGGYNLQQAFSTGYLAGSMISKFR